MSLGPDNNETFPLPDDLEPLKRLRVQLDQALQLAEAGHLLKLTESELAERKRHPDILGEIGDFQIRWRNGPHGDTINEIREWRRAALEAMAYLSRGMPERAHEILSQRFNS